MSATARGTRPTTRCGGPWTPVACPPRAGLPGDTPSAEGNRHAVVIDHAPSGPYRWSGPRGARRGDACRVHAQPRWNRSDPSLPTSYCSMRAPVSPSQDPSALAGGELRDRTVAYDAFVSYSHAADSRLAPALQRGMQQLAKPWYRLRALAVFLDESALSANPQLWSSVESALDDSAWFVLLASPEAAASKWVNREV